MTEREPQAEASKVLSGRPADTPSGHSAGSTPADSVHPLVRVGAEWTWRLLVIFAGFITFFYVVARLDTVVIPLGLALLASAMLVPIVDWM